MPKITFTAAEKLRAIAVASSVQDAAAVFARQLDNTGDVLADRLEAEFTAKQVVKMSALTILVTVKKLIQDMPADKRPDIDSFPVPGSTVRDIGPERNGLPDEYEYTITSEQGKTTTRKGSFYNDLFDDLAIGQRIKEQLRLFKLAANPKIIRSEIPAHILEQGDNPKDYADIAKALAVRQSSGRSLMFQAFQIQFQANNIHDNYPDCEVRYRFDTDSNGNPVPAHYRSSPIYIVNTEKDMTYQDYTVSSFLSLDPLGELEKKARPTYADLIASGLVVREKPPTGGGLMNTVAEFFGQAKRMISALDQRRADSLHNPVVKELKAGKDAVDNMITMCDLYLELQPFYQANHLKYNAAVEARDKREEKEKQELLDKQKNAAA